MSLCFLLLPCCDVKNCDDDVTMKSDVIFHTSSIILMMFLVPLSFYRQHSSESHDKQEEEEHSQ
jgi:hypothetical protein